MKNESKNKIPEVPLCDTWSVISEKKTPKIADAAIDCDIVSDVK